MTVRVRDLMTTGVITVREDATFREVVLLLDQHQVSALPVVDAEGRVTGIVSEADLLLKEAQDDLVDPQWLEAPARREARAKAAGRIVRDLMTAPAVTATPSTTILEAARRLHEHNVKRLPVVDAEGRAVGVLSRGDVMRVFLREDSDIRDDVSAILTRALGADPAAVEVAVEDGVLTLSGRLPLRSDVEVLERLAGEVAGIVAVRSRVAHDRDDGAAIEHRLAVLDLPL